MLFDTLIFANLDFDMISPVTTIIRWFKVLCKTSNISKFCALFQISYMILMSKGFGSCLHTNYYGIKLAFCDKELQEKAVEWNRTFRDQGVARWLASSLTKTQVLGSSLNSVLVCLINNFFQLKKHNI